MALEYINGGQWCELILRVTYKIMQKKRLALYCIQEVDMFKNCCHLCLLIQTRMGWFRRQLIQYSYWFCVLGMCPSNGRRSQLSRSSWQSTTRRSQLIGTRRADSRRQGRTDCSKIADSRRVENRVNYFLIGWLLLW